jgi:hypothetical protein
MRRTLAATLLAAVTVVTMTAFSAPASAVCGGGQPGEPCYCPDISIKGRPLITC